MPARRIKVVVVEDSRVVRELLLHVLQSDPRIEVIGAAAEGAEALELIARTKPDLVTMDIHMPGMDGFEVTRRIMETNPVPIVIVTASFDADDVARSFRAIEAGALAMVEKPGGPGHSNHESCVRKLIEAVTTMAGVRVIRRWSRMRQAPAPARPIPPIASTPRRGAAVRLVAIGASTGGPPILQTILAALPKPFPVPILIVQHISAGFVQGFVDWLGNTTGMPVKLASNGLRALPGLAYVAPDGLQMRVEREERIVCALEPAENNVRPSVAALFRSAAENYGAAAIGVLLTGMGRDGADELRLMRDRGAVTFAQDEASSIIFGMPGEAVKIGGATYVFPPDRIAAALETLVATGVGATTL